MGYLPQDFGVYPSRSPTEDMAADRTVILSTHIVSDVEAIATGIAIRRQG